MTKEEFKDLEVGDVVIYTYTTTLPEFFRTTVKIRITEKYLPTLVNPLLYAGTVIKGDEIYPKGTHFSLMTASEYQLPLQHRSRLDLVTDYD